MNVLALLASSAVLLPSPGGQTVSVDERFSVGELVYRVTSVQDGAKTYTQRFDQRESKFTPGFESERMVVLNFEVENPTAVPQRFASILPAIAYGDGSQTDRPRWDVEQKSQVRTSNDLLINPQDNYNFSFDPVDVAPSGRVRFALVFSHPARTKAIKLSIEPGRSTVISGILVTQPDNGPRTTVTLG